MFRKMNRKLGRWSSILTMLVLFMFVWVYQYRAAIYFEQDVTLDTNQLDNEFNHPYFSPGNDIINPIDAKYRIDGAGICNKISRKSVLVLIPSVKKDLEFRNTLRRTWVGALLKDKWPNEKLEYEFRVAFIFGSDLLANMDDQSLQMEHSIYGDIVQGSFIDSYYNLTRKTLFGLKWASQYCKDAHYVMKIDMDTFAHIPKLFRKISYYNDKPNGKIFGRLWEKSEPHRSGKWKIEYKDYPPVPFYPPYCDGPIYVISTSAISRIVSTSERMPYLHLEDVFVTGIVAKIAQVNRIDVLQRVDFRNYPEWVCTFRVSSDNWPINIADSGYTVRQIDQIWTCMQNGPSRHDYFKYYLLKMDRSWFTLMYCLIFICLVIVLLLFR